MHAPASCVQWSASYTHVHTPLLPHTPEDILPSFLLAREYDYVKGRGRYLLPPARLYERRFRSAKTQKHIPVARLGSRAHPFTHPTFADVFNLKDNPKFNQFKITNFF